MCDSKGESGGGPPIKGYTGKDGQFIDHYNSSRKDRNREGLEKYEGGGGGSSSVTIQTYTQLTVYSFQP